MPIFNPVLRDCGLRVSGFSETFLKGPENVVFLSAVNEPSQNVNLWSTDTMFDSLLIPLESPKWRPNVLADFEMLIIR